MKGFLLLIQFMTRFPTPLSLPYDGKKLGQAIKYFPILGLIIGLFLVLFYFILTQYIESKLVVALIIVVMEILITGGLHIDGLSDSFDGLFSYRDKKRILEIMKDSRIGANGALVMMVYLLAKVILLSELSWEFVLIMPVVARLNTVLHACFGVYARVDGMGKNIVEETTVKGFVFALFFTLILCMFLLKLPGLILVLFCTLFGFTTLYFIQKRIDGITGDTMGAVLELTSVFVLLVGVFF